MLTTTNLKLNKPDISDKYDISLFNENADIIDSSITDISNAIAGIPKHFNDVDKHFDDVDSRIDDVDKQLVDVDSRIGVISSTKVDKTDGKALSDNNLTNALKSCYDAAYTHSLSAHARTDATNIRNSSVNGNILINGTDTCVYSHPATSGYRHIPSGGKAGQILRWSADGTAVWGPDANTVYSAASSSTAGVSKLYNSLGSATDGSVTQKTVNDAISSLKKSVSDGKALVAAAITENGKATAADAAFQTLADNIGIISKLQYNSGYTQGKASNSTAVLTTGGYTSKVDDDSENDLYHVVFYINGKPLKDIELGPRYDGWSTRIYERLVNWSITFSI